MYKHQMNEKTETKLEESILLRYGVNGNKEAG